MATSSETNLVSVESECKPKDHHIYLGENTLSLILPSTHVNNTTPGKIATYTNQKYISLLAGISSRTAIDGTNHTLKPGTKVRICTRPVHSSISTEKQVRIHINEHVWSTGHDSECRCGNCEKRFEVSSEPPPKCNCGCDPFDPGQQPCTIM